MSEENQTEPPFSLEDRFAKMRELLGVDPSKTPEGEIEIQQWGDVLKLMPSVINLVEKSVAGKDINLLREKIAKGDGNFTEFVEDIDFEELRSRIKFASPVVDTL